MLQYKTSGTVRPIKDHILVEEMEFGFRKTRAGVIILADDGKDRGIRPRWGKVFAIGPDQDEIKIGQWILVEHGRWTRGVEVDGVMLRRVDTKDVMLVTDDEPHDEYVRDL